MFSFPNGLESHTPSTVAGQFSCPLNHFSSSDFGFDEQDKDYYLRLFADVLQRNPTIVELYDLSQSNSEHSRHWFFGGMAP